MFKVDGIMRQVNAMRLQVKQQFVVDGERGESKLIAMQIFYSNHNNFFLFFFCVINYNLNTVWNRTELVVSLYGQEKENQVVVTQVVVSI